MINSDLIMRVLSQPPACIHNSKVHAEPLTICLRDWKWNFFKMVRNFPMEFPFWMEFPEYYLTISFKTEISGFLAKW